MQINPKKSTSEKSFSLEICPRKHGKKKERKNIFIANDVLQVHNVYKYIKIKIFIRANLFLEYKDLVKKTITKYQALFTVLVINLFRNTYRHMASSWQNWSALRWWHYLLLYWPWTIWLFPNFLSLAPLGFYKASLVTLNVQDSELRVVKTTQLGNAKELWRWERRQSIKVYRWESQAPYKQAVLFWPIAFNSLF